MNAPFSLNRKKYRTIWISDVHLGYKGCKAEYLLHFLQSTECEFLYLVGDIVDIWSMQRNLFWPQSHNDIVKAILDKARSGTRVVYIPGNHDDMLRHYQGVTFGNIVFRNEYVHTSKSGKRFLILHGDEFDAVIKCGRLATFFGYYGYDFLLFVNRHFNHVRRYLGLPYWSLASFLKGRFKNAMQYVVNFQETAVYAARKRNAHGVICGHIHHADITDLNGTIYLNTGDWVENCTALVENETGEIELLHWSERYQTVKTLTPNREFVDSEQVKAA